MNPQDFLKPADINFISCVDERLGKGKADDGRLPVEVPGGIYGIIDGIKTLLKISEAQAWDMVEKADLPIGIHFGPVHGHGHGDKETVGPLGCGYAAKVEGDPFSVGAPEKVVAADRLERVKRIGGKIYEVIGPHQIDYCTLVFCDGMSIDSDEALGKLNKGILNCDAWAARHYAEMLNEAFPETPIDLQALVDYVANSFRLTAKVLAPSLSVIEIS